MTSVCEPPGRLPVKAQSSTVAKALDVLELVSQSSQGITNLEIHQMLGLDKSTVHRLLSTLESRGYVARHPDRRYVIGLQPALLAWRGDADPRMSLMPVLQDLADLTTEAASVNLVDGVRLRCIATVPGKHELNYTPEAGATYDPIASAAGLASWAWRSDPLRDEWIQQVCSLTDPRLLRTRAELVQELDRTRLMGYAISNQERFAGAAAVAAPIFLGPADPIGAVVISTVSARTSLDQLRTYADAAIAAAARLGNHRN